MGSHLHFALAATLGTHPTGWVRSLETAIASASVQSRNKNRNFPPDLRKIGQKSNPICQNEKRQMRAGRAASRFSSNAQSDASAKKSARGAGTHGRNRLADRSADVWIAVFPCARGT